MMITEVSFGSVPPAAAEPATVARLTARPLLRRGRRAALLTTLGICLAIHCDLPAADALLLRGAIVHTVSGGTLSPCDVLLKDGRIAAVGTTMEVGGATVVDLSGLHLYPGLIALNTSLGLVEINAVRATRDSVEVGQFTPDVRSWIAVNPDSELIPVARANGVTHAHPVPGGGTVSGYSGLIRLSGWTTEDLTVKAPTGLHITWPSMRLDTRPKEELKDKAAWKSLEDQDRERRVRLRELDEFFAEARAYAGLREAAGKRGTPDAGLVPAWEAMLPFLRGDAPLMIHADEIREIKAAVAWVRTNEFRMILVGGKNAGRMAEELAAANIPVIFDSVFDLPDEDTSTYDSQFSTPATLHRAGVKFAFSEGGRHDASSVRNLPYAAAQAVAYGLPAAVALRAMTLHAAELLGVGHRLGSIEPGKDAALFAADGDILDIRTRVRRVWIEGSEVSVESRHTRLYERYRQRPRPQR